MLRRASPCVGLRTWAYIIVLSGTPSCSTGNSAYYMSDDDPEAKRSDDGAHKDVSDGTGDGGGSDDSGTDDGDVGTDDGDTGGTALEEVCDGFDNDGDGQTDEDLDGETCTMEGGGQGERQCVGGRWLCRDCEPGAVRETPCGCDTSRVDVCGDDGTWRVGTCDGCSSPASLPCAYCGQYAADGTCTDPGECMPGVERMRRCDSCTSNPETCGSSCVGALWRCNDACVWEQVSACTEQPADCNRDQVIVEPCGVCGHEALQCDGCFWVGGMCSEEGVCRPGERLTVPCVAESCEEGLAATVVCNNSCTWDPPGACYGCSLSDSNLHEEHHACAPGHDACGERVTQTECRVVETVDVCGGDQTLSTGGEITEVLQDDCVNLPCTPGQRNERVPCRTAADECGYYTRVCSDECTWVAETECAPRPNACVPGETRNQQTLSCGSNTCGATYTVVETCRSNGCGWRTISTSDDCPPCSANDQGRTESCTTDGRCGARTVQCDPNTCEWIRGTCEPLPDACELSDVDITDCTGVCGRRGRQHWVCDGCTMVKSGTCELIDPVPCEPGDEEVVEVCYAGTACEQIRRKVCSVNCEWLMPTSCEPCG